MRNVVILGSTGSIGTQTLEILAGLGEEYRVLGLSAHSNVESLAGQIRRWRPDRVAVRDEEAAARLVRLLSETGTAHRPEILTGEAGLVRLAASEADLVVNAVVGNAGLPATLAALEAGSDVALANKESLVAGGELVTATVRRTGTRLLPVDSEHSAIFQCLAGRRDEEVRRILLTASGGPFRGRHRAELARVTPAEALRHPTWQMGARITVDSATMMNKGLEVIEAHHLFGVELDRIEVVVHPESILHSAVEFVDGSVLGQLGHPDMRHPIQYALTYPERRPPAVPLRFLDLVGLGSLTFEAPDLETFPGLSLAYQAARRGGTLPAVMNAAKEVAVDRFLEGEISFLAIPRIVARVMEEHNPASTLCLEDIQAADGWARRRAYELSEEA